MTVLVTGGTGFVGSAVVRALLAEGHAVRVLTRAGSDLRNLSGLAIEVMHGDLTDQDSLKPAVAGGSALFHVAADYRLWVPDPSPLYRTNVEGTVDLLTLAAEAGVEKIVYTSSVATLGLNSGGSPADEETPVSEGDMIGHYKRSKFLAEREVRSLIEARNLPCVIVNPSTPMGPGDLKPTPTGRLILEAVEGRMPAFVDTGLNVVHVDDVARGHLLAYERGEVGRRYILGGENLTLQEILTQVSSLTGRAPPKLRIPHSVILPIAWIAEGWARLSRSGEPFVTLDGIRMARKTMFFSSARAEAELGYASRPAAEAIRAAVDWFRGEWSSSPPG